MSELEIRIAMLKKGIRQVDIARKLGVTRQHVNHVIRGKYSSKRVEKELKKILENTN